MNDSTNTIWPQQSKILTADEAQRTAEKLRKEGKVIGFTNGCFDLLHLGHMYSFVQARELCDVLFVGVNSDASVKSYKGPNRPVHDEQTRSLLVAALPFVDYVVVFSERTAIPLVDKIHPEVTAKEGYTLENWPEGQHVVDYGGRAVILKRLDGYSTTGFVKRMQCVE